MTKVGLGHGMVRSLQNQASLSNIFAMADVAMDVPNKQYHDGAVAAVVYRRHRLSNRDSRVLFFSPSYSVKPTLPHTPNDLFDQIWRKGVPFGTLVQ